MCIIITIIIVFTQKKDQKSSPSFSPPPFLLHLLFYEKLEWEDVRYITCWSIYIATRDTLIKGLLDRTELHMKPYYFSDFWKAKFKKQINIDSLVIAQHFLG